MAFKVFEVTNTRKNRSVEQIYSMLRLTFVILNHLIGFLNGADILDAILKRL